MVYGDARHGRFTENLTGFVRLLRRAGLPVDVARNEMAQLALTHIDIGHAQQVRAALCTILVTRQSDWLVFHQLFDAYFRDPEIARQLLSQLLPQTPGQSIPQNRSPRAQEALFLSHLQKTPPAPAKDSEFEFDAAMSATDQRRLRHADFESLNASEYQLVQQLAQTIRVTWPRIASRRSQPKTRGHQLDWPALARDTARQDLEMMTLPWRAPKQQTMPLLILVDISGSMSRYARLMLAFLHQATRGLHPHVFALGTRLTDLSPLFQINDTDTLLNRFNETVTDFGGGTCLGACLHTLHQHHRKAVTGQRTLVLLISDGLETGDANQLNAEAAWLCQQTRLSVWLNPLLRFDGYEPLAQGAAILAKHFDHHLPIHNLERLQQLAQSLKSILRKPVPKRRAMPQFTHSGAPSHHTRVTGSITL